MRCGPARPAARVVQGVSALREQCRVCCHHDVIPAEVAPAQAIWRMFGMRSLRSTEVVNMTCATHDSRGGVGGGLGGEGDTVPNVMRMTLPASRSVAASMVSLTADRPKSPVNWACAQGGPWQSAHADMSSSSFPSHTSPAHQLFRHRFAFEFQRALPAQGEPHLQCHRRTLMLHHPRQWPQPLL